jgi:hypothetical protein
MRIGNVGDKFRGAGGVAKRQSQYRFHMGAAGKRGKRDAGGCREIIFEDRLGAGGLGGAKRQQCGDRQRQSQQSAGG